MAEITPTPSVGHWIVFDPRGNADHAPNEITPTPRVGHWIVFDPPLRRGFRHVGLVRGARG